MLLLQVVLRRYASERVKKRSYEKEHIDGLKAKFFTLDQALLERCIFVFCLQRRSFVVAIIKTSYRLSTDIDFVIKPLINTIQFYLDKVGRIFPCIRMEEQIRKGSHDEKKLVQYMSIKAFS